MSNALKRYIRTLPKVYNPQLNPVILALLKAIASQDDQTAAQVQAAKDQLFVRTATGQNLDKLANSLGVSRPQSLGLTDAEFQELIPNLSLKPKQIRKAFYDTADVFWGPSFSRSNITTANAAPFNVSPGDELRIRIDSGEIQEIKVLTADVAVPGAATAQEIQKILSRIEGATVEVREDQLTGDETINLRTNTPGPVGNIEIFGDSSILGAAKLDFPVGSFSILNLDQRVAVYNIEPNELLIEIPAIVPALRRTLRGSHHFPADGTIYPGPGTFLGSFLFNPDGSQGTFTVSSQRATLQQIVNKGEVQTSIAVDDTSNFEISSGQLIFGFGTENQEVPVRFRGVPNSNTILIDPAYTFINDHAPGTVVNVLRDNNPYEPRRNGQDLAVYLTSPSGAREIVEEILATLQAAGIIVRFLVLAPKYKYILDNPYISDDNAPEC